MENGKKRKVVTFLGTILILAGIGVAVHWYRNKQVTIPDVKGMSYEDAVSTIKAELRKAGIRDASFYEGWIDAPGYALTVASQDPKAGTTVRRGEEVSVYLYVGEGWDNMTRSISYELDKDMIPFFAEMPTSATPGYTVRITTQVLMDADIHVYANGEEIEKTNSDSDGWEYTFVMPSTDVLVTAEWYTKQEMNGEVGE
ncbi:MAG: PASTA domain-containing protein [Lachnospiraceae bacterium]|nr:PASTA domain-containing protein [Lachnospiraceae bacterium]